MPEGDTLHRMAARLRPLLVGQTLDRVSVRERGDVPALAGARVVSVEARGKHLLIQLSSGDNLRVHLGMRGRLGRHAVAEANRYRYASLLLCAGVQAFVWSHAKEVEVFRGRPEHSRALARLGPDLLGSAIDFDAVVARARQLPGGVPLGVLLLDQRVAAGIGNVYKSEVLFSCRQNPFAPVSSVDDDALRALYECARSSLHNNLGRGPRVTVQEPNLRSAIPVRAPRHWVYERSGQPCRVCDTPIALRRQGDDQRSTYFCPSCQQVDAVEVPRARR